jgi:hypothetical protein
VRRGASRRAALALLATLLVGTASCAPRTLRTDQLERRLAREVGSELDVAGVRVACPEPIEIREGDVFDCVATAPDGDRLRIRVTQLDDQGTLTWEPAPPADG